MTAFALQRRRFLAVASLCTLGAVVRPSAADSPAPRAAASGGIKTGGVRMVEVDGKYHVWTKRVGHGKAKVLTLHGGPGCTHEYFECFEDFLPDAGFELYYYDQLGSVYSDQPNDTSLWTLPRFVEEVEQVRRGLGLENFYLLGHSWGSMLAIDYALKYQQHLKGLVLCDMTAGIAAYLKYVNELMAQLPPEARATIKKYEDAGDFDAQEYQDVLMEQFYKKHICRL
ncbi:MAG TPA: proline iminopeptidase-family hydrolase, partial [Rudaea sp.]|nr:proline iminopeptidase-family hydrolase [Rudaea sp.]